MIEIIPNLHPIFVHFTVALLNIGVLFYVLVLVTGVTKWRFQWLTVARWNLWLGAGFAIVTATFGWFAFNSVTHDDPSHIAMLEHRAWAITTLAVFIPLAIWSWLKHRNDGDVNKIYVVLLVAALGVLMSTAWHGAELVYRHGLGVMSLPKAEGEGHAHAHEDGGGHGNGETRNMNGNTSMSDVISTDKMMQEHNDNDNHHEGKEDDHHDDEGAGEHTH